MVYFYALTYDTEFNPNMVFYVGKTVSKEQRLSGHKATFGKNCVLHQIDFLDQYDKLLIAGREQYWIIFACYVNFSYHTSAFVLPHTCTQILWEGRFYS